MNNYEAHRFREILFDVFENGSFEIPKNLPILNDMEVKSQNKRNLTQFRDLLVLRSC